MENSPDAVENAAPSPALERFLVIGRSFTEHSIKLAHQYKAGANWDIAFVTAEGLKHLAERWTAQEPEKPLPIRLLSRTEHPDPVK